MKPFQRLQCSFATLLFSLAFFSAAGQEVICVDSVHYHPQAVCPAIYIPLCGCDGSDPGNDCEAFNRAALSCWSQRCDRINLGCEVAFSYSIEGDQLLLQDESPTADGDEVAYWNWQHNYESFAMDTAEAALDMPPGQTQFKVSLSIRTTQGCIAYCTYLIDRTIDTSRESTEVEPSVYPNPANRLLHLRNVVRFHHLQVYSLDGRRQMEQPLQGASLEQIEVGELNPGIYLVVLSGERGRRVLKVAVL